MPADFRIHPEHGFVFSRAWGELTDQDLLDHQSCLRSHPDFRPDMNQLFDFWDVSDVRVSSSGIRAYADSTPFSEKARRALVVRQPVMYGLARMLQMLTENVVPDTVVQRNNVQAACEWLGIPTTLPGLERASTRSP